MLSTIIFCQDRPSNPSGRDLAGVLARTLAPLVSAKVEGLLGDVRIAGPAGRNLSALANHAGCGLIEAEGEADWLAAAVRAARGPDVFLLQCGRAPEPGFIEEASDFLAGNGRGAAACLRAMPESFLERMLPSLLPVAGLIARRDLLLAAPRAGFAKLASFARPATAFRARARRIS